MQSYVPRTLSYSTAPGGPQTISDVDVLALGASAVVLGEPGTGKSATLRYLALAPNTVLRSATSFVEHPDPKALVAEGQTLLIDGLDELVALNATDPVNRVLRQLIASRHPRFILSCRAADWRGAIARQEIADAYGEVPIELRLNPLSVADAVTLLQTVLNSDRAEAAIEQLTSRGLGELLGNPLTVKLFAEIAEDPAEAPNTRAELYDRAASIMWNERNDRHERSLLNQLDQTAALDAAGAISASLILTGAEAVAVTPTAKGARGVIDIAAAAALPGATEAQAILSSRLFVPAIELGAMKPIHRSVAEYLGARWLARSARTPLARARLLTSLIIDGGPPSSLRGLHAWLAHFSPDMARDVIENDPYGVIRYGDADGLSAEHARWLLAALQRKERENPHFRAEDWEPHQVKGFARAELSDTLRTVINDRTTSFHLRSLLLEAIKGSAVAVALQPDLRAIMMCEDEGRYAYRERYAAALCLLGLGEGDIEWREIVQTLGVSANEDSTRLALEIMHEAGYAQFKPEWIAKTALTHLGVGLRNGEQDRRSSSASMYMLSRRLPATQIEPLLDALVLAMPIVPEGADYEVRSELTALVLHLLTRFIADRDPDPAKLVAWLRITPERISYAVSDNEVLAKYLSEAENVRHAVQHILLFDEGPARDAWSRIWRTHELHHALTLSEHDVIFFLNILASKENPDENDVALWRELADFARRTDTGADDILAAAKPFVRGDPDRQLHLTALAGPAPRPEWEVREEKRKREAAAKRDVETRQHRKLFGENIEALERGELRWVLPVARSYFALFSDSDRSLSPGDRIGDWLGSDLQIAALKGLHAVLDRDDLPSLEQIVGSYVQSRRWNFIHPMLASLVERFNRGEPIIELGADRIIALRIALHHEYMGDRTDLSALVGALEEAIWKLNAAERYARLLIEPYLEARAEHISGLHALLNMSAAHDVTRSLVAEWLQRFPDMHPVTEAELIDYLAGQEAYGVLADLARSRLATDFGGEERLLTWQTALLLSDFPAGMAAIGDRPQPSLFWHVRHRFGRGRFADERLPPVSPAHLHWAVRQFRASIPVVSMPQGVSTGDTNDWDATQAMRGFIDRLAQESSDEAAALLQELARAPRDVWTDYLLSSADRQRSARREAAFVGIDLRGLRALLCEGAPQTVRDLRAVVLWALQGVQTRLRGSDTDIVAKYFDDAGHPRGEDACTDRLLEDLEPLLAPHGVGRIPQRDMPSGKRADIVFTADGMALPVECKSQWNASLWKGASEQLDALYLRDWRAGNMGVYLVYWFGMTVSASRALKAPPGSRQGPETAGELKQALIERLPRERRDNIAIEVLDFSR